MKKFILSFIGSCLFFTINVSAMSKPLPDHNTPADPNALFFIVAGQSNAYGASLTTRLTKNDRRYLKVPANVNFYYAQVDESLPVVELRTNFDDQPRQGSHNFGPEMLLAYTLSEAYPEKKIVILKYAAPGTSTYDWAPKWKRIAGVTQTDPIYNKLYSKLLARIQEVETSEGVKRPIEALFWAQAEADAMLNLDGYMKRTQVFINQLKKDTGSPDMKLIVGRMFDYESIQSPLFENWELFRKIRQEQTDVCYYLPNSTFVNTDDFTLLDETFQDKPIRIHYDENSQVMFGRRLGEAYLAF